MVSRGLLIGRFQPFHKGHLWAVREILNREDEIIIGIGSAQDSYSIENPLTAGERVEIVREVLKNLGVLDRAVIIPIPDINENLAWPGRVIELTPRFDRVYSGNELVLMLFERFGIETVKLEHINRDIYQGRVIRELIVKGEPWEHLVPESIIPLLKKFGFEERIRRLAARR
ncbi:MAG: nicotinamide-nucleotide adenylyltransferase [Candidatus Njordarchaeales archaeon]